MTDIARTGSELVATVTALHQANAIMRRLGWRLLDVTANETTGFVRIIAEARDGEARSGTQILLLRSSHDGEVLEMRSRVRLVSGMYTSEWEVGDHLGRRRFTSLSVAAREMLAYACDNGPVGALTEAESGDRRAALASAMTALAANLGTNEP